MDSLTQVRLTREFVDIDSTTGREGEAGAWLAATLRRLGYDVVEQPVRDGRFNVIATAGRPDLVFSTHVDELLDGRFAQLGLARVRGVAWPADPDLGETFYTIGVINGGVAPNVIPPTAEAEAMFRTVSGHDAVRAALETCIAGRITADDVLVVPPVRLKTVPGFETAVFSFTTDIPFLDAWGAPLLLGPGSVALAHTADEYVLIAELHQAVDSYVRLAKHLLG